MYKRLIESIKVLGYVFIGLFLLLILYFIYDVERFNQKIYRGVYLAERDISGFTKDEFNNLIEDIQLDIETKRIFIEHKRNVIEVRPSDVGLHFRSDEVWGNAYAYGHESNFVERLLTWFNSFQHQHEIALVSFSDHDLLEQALDAWEKKIPAQEPYHGSLAFSGVQLTLQYPENGYSLNREELARKVVYALLNETSGHVVTAPLTVVEPLRTDQDLVDNAHAIEQVIGMPIELYIPDDQERRVVLDIRDLADISYLEYPDDPSDMIALRINTAKLAGKLATLYPHDARFDISEDEQISVIPSQDGYDIDLNSSAEQIIKKARRSIREIPLNVNAYVKPDFDTQDAEALGIEHLVSRFTTYHSCCQSRVKNIQLVADIVDGTILKPNEVLDMNDLLGERTTERGFEEAGTIIEGELQESVGGGISQFMTTFHNAVYWGGYQIIAHKPHSRYFSRYPIGIEATINWPYIDYLFKNDTETGLLIHTSYTDTSITVSFYGANGGRIAIGDHQQGSTNIDISGSSEQSRKVVSKVSKAYLKRPAPITYEADPSVARGEEVIVSEGDDRWSVSVERTVMQADQVLRYDFWPVNYQGEETIIKKHPCDLYDPEFDYEGCNE